MTQSNPAGQSKERLYQLGIFGGIGSAIALTPQGHEYLEWTASIEYAPLDLENDAAVEQELQEYEDATQKYDMEPIEQPATATLGSLDATLTNMGKDQRLPPAVRDRAGMIGTVVDSSDVHKEHARYSDELAESLATIVNQAHQAKQQEYIDQPVTDGIVDHSLALLPVALVAYGAGKVLHRYETTITNTFETIADKCTRIYDSID